MKRILLDITPHQRRVAFVQDGQLIELLYGHKEQDSIVGNIYTARVENVLQGMKAAFLDIGEEKNAYYYYGSNDAALEKARKPVPGSEVLVQVEKPGTALKGPVVTTKLSFPGKFLVLIPGENGTVGISRKITDSAERARIHALVKRDLPANYGAVVRTDAVGKTEDDFQQEILRLLEVSENVLQSGKYRKAPSLLYRELDPVFKTVRDLWGGGVDEVVVNDAAAYEELRQMQQLYGLTGSKLIFYDKPVPLFGEYHIESQTEKAFLKKVWLKSGGFLVIEQTEACVVIDVNTGKYTGKKDLEATFLRTNLEAAAEIARQLRLRNLSGLIIVDFIDLKEDSHKAQLHQALKDAVMKDRVKTVVVGMTELGLMQLTRKKTGPSLRQVMTCDCPCCDGTGVVASLDHTAAKIGREISSMFAQTVYNQVTVTAQNALLAAFAGPGDRYRLSIEKAYGKKILLKEDASFAVGAYRLDGLKTED